jgi:hypothetical protein
MSDDQSWKELLEHHLREVRNRIAHMDEHQTATLRDAVERRIQALYQERRIPALYQRSSEEQHGLSEIWKGLGEQNSQVHPATPTRQHSRKRNVHLYIGDAGQLASKATSYPRSSPVVPPTGAWFLLDLILSKADRKAIAGDLKEEFATSILPKYGAGRARFWFWTQTVRTIATRNPVCRWVLVYGLARVGEWILRKIGS